MTLPTLTPSQLYRLLHTGNEGDLNFYCRAADGAARILDLGAGWGRIAVPLIQKGHDVVGVDLNREFLEEAEQSARTLQDEVALGDVSRGCLRLLQQDLRHIDLEERFDRIFIGYNTLYALGGRAEVTTALSRAKDHLAKGGEIWFDVYAMDEFHRGASSGEAPGDDHTREEVFRETRAEGTLVVYETSALNLRAQSLDVRYEAELDKEPIGSSVLTHHYLLLSEIWECLDEAGLEAAAVFGGFREEPADEEAEHIVVCAVPRDAENEDPDPRRSTIR